MFGHYNHAFVLIHFDHSAEQHMEVFRTFFAPRYFVAYYLPVMANKDFQR